MTGPAAPSMRRQDKGKKRPQPTPGAFCPRLQIGIGSVVSQVVRQQSHLSQHSLGDPSQSSGCARGLNRPGDQPVAGEAPGS